MSTELFKFNAKTIYHFIKWMRFYQMNAIFTGNPLCNCSGWGTKAYISTFDWLCVRSDVLCVCVHLRVCAGVCVCLCLCMCVFMCIYARVFGESIVCVWLVFYYAFNNLSVLSRRWLLVAWDAICARVLSASNTDAQCRRHKSRMHHPATLSWLRATFSPGFTLFMLSVYRGNKPYHL